MRRFVRRSPREKRPHWDDGSGRNEVRDDFFRGQQRPMKAIRLPAAAEIDGVNTALEEDPSREVAPLADLAGAQNPSTGGNLTESVTKLVDRDVHRPGHTPLGKLLRRADVPPATPPTITSFICDSSVRSVPPTAARKPTRSVGNAFPAESPPMATVNHETADRPPSSRRIWPQRKFDAGDARKRTRSATSGVTSRRRRRPD